MRRELGAVIAVAALWACGGATYSGSDGGADGGSSSSSGGSGSSSGGSSSGGSSSSGGGHDGGGPAPINHRPDDSQCVAPAPPGDCTYGGQAPVECTQDSQCSTGTNGRCTNDGPIAGCHCTYDSCAQDSDCPTGQTCACHGSPYTYDQGNTCTPGNCRVDADCGDGGYCSPAENSMSCGGVLGFYCHTAGDLCVNDSDCSAGGPQVCTYSTAAGRWQCEMEGLCG